MDEPFHYVGQELDVFAHAANWKRYFCRQARPYIRGRVLEVGAGIGGTVRQMCGGTEASWTCLEPDVEIAAALKQSLKNTPLPIPHTVYTSTTADLTDKGPYDTIIYIDVIEHIEDDVDEVNRAADLLSPNGSIIVLSPAHNWLFSEFDNAIGHFRRYNRAMIRRITPPHTSLFVCRYLDSVGMFASLANRLLLRAASPTMRQIRLWDRVMIRMSVVIDVLLFYSQGRSILAVWRKSA